LFHAVMPTVAGFVTLRSLVLVMMTMLIITIMRSDKRILIISPLLVLSVLALVGYSFVEALFAQFPDYFSYEKKPDPRTLSYPGSLGESLVLQFIAFCLLLTAIIFRLAPDGAPKWDDPSLRHPMVVVTAVAALAIVASVVVDISVASNPALKGFLTTGIGKQFADSGDPITALSFAVLAYGAGTRGRVLTALFFSLAIIYLMVKSSIGLVQMPIAIVVVAVTFYLLIGKKNPYVIGLAACVILAFALIIVFGIAHTRYKTDLGPTASVFKTIKFVLSYKVILRQGQSAYCFNTIVSGHRPAPNSEKPFYFLSAVVPRFIYKDKPNLSRGHEFVTKYCGDTSTLNKQHYELVTILAEPVLEGGFTGLAAVQLFLGVSLTFVTLVMLRGGPITVITIVALLPWLTHFQQSFALYFANSVKMYFYMLPAIALLWWWMRRQGPVKPESSL
jgi:hypothetical protein